MPPTLENPVETSISMFMWTDAIERGPGNDGVAVMAQVGKDKLDVPDQNDLELCWQLLD